MILVSISTNGTGVLNHQNTEQLERIAENNLKRRLKNEVAELDRKIESANNGSDVISIEERKAQFEQRVGELIDGFIQVFCANGKDPLPTHLASRKLEIFELLREQGELIDKICKTRQDQPELKDKSKKDDLNDQKPNKTNKKEQNHSGTNLS